MAPDGSGEMRLTNNASFDSDPSFSPDGRRIAFVRSEGGGNTDVYVMNADGSGRHSPYE